MDNNLLFLAYLLSLQDNQGGGALDRNGCLITLLVMALIYGVIFLVIFLI